MHASLRSLVAVCALACATAAVLAQAPAPVQEADVKIYEAFRAWIGQQPPGDDSTILDRYRKILAGEGLSTTEVERRIAVVIEQGQKLEIERWNRILTAPTPTFNVKPNAFLVQMTQGRKPGRALDVGMGQGRNAIYLAQQGWDVTGFDPADRAVAAAQAEAKRLGVKLTTSVVGDEQFDFGREQWDLIVLSYVTLRHLTDKLYQSLKPGGLVVVEAFHRDATKEAPVGGGVVYDTDELPKLFARYRIVRYEDAQGVSDFGLRNTRVVRLAAQKP